MRKLVGTLLCAGLLGACASRSSGEALGRLREDERSLRDEIRALEGNIVRLRASTDRTVQVSLPAGSAMAWPDGDVSRLRLQWRSTHAGVRLLGTLTPTGRGEKAPGTVSVRREGR